MKVITCEFFSLGMNFFCELLEMRVSWPEYPQLREKKEKLSIVVVELIIAWIWVIKLINSPLFNRIGSFAFLLYTPILDLPHLLWYVGDMDGHIWPNQQSSKESCVG